MSALGQKPTYALQQAMSALHPIATAKAKFRKRPCLLYPRKRTCAAQEAMSALGQRFPISILGRLDEGSVNTGRHLNMPLIFVGKENATTTQFCGSSPTIKMITRFSSAGMIMRWQSTNCLSKRRQPRLVPRALPGKVGPKTLDRSVRTNISQFANQITRRGKKRC